MFFEKQLIRKLEQSINNAILPIGLHDVPLDMGRELLRNTVDVCGKNKKIICDTIAARAPCINLNNVNLTLENLIFVNDEQIWKCTHAPAHPNPNAINSGEAPYLAASEHPLVTSKIIDIIEFAHEDDTPMLNNNRVNASLIPLCFIIDNIDENNTTKAHMFIIPSVESKHESTRADDSEFKFLG